MVNTELTKWYALDQIGDIVYLGEFERFEDADDSTEYSSVWVVDEDIAKGWLISLLIFNQQHGWGLKI